MSLKEFSYEGPKRFLQRVMVCSLDVADAETLRQNATLEYTTPHRSVEDPTKPLLSATFRAHISNNGSARLRLPMTHMVFGLRVGGTQSLLGKLLSL